MFDEFLRAESNGRGRSQFAQTEPTAGHIVTACYVATMLSLLGFVLPAWGEGAARHVAQSTQPQPAPSLASVPVKSGVLRRKKGRDAIAPLRIETPISPDYVLKLINSQNGSEEMLIYVGRDSRYETKVPLGTYKIRGVFGETWYGEKHLFGPDSSYFRLVQKDGRSDEFTFRRTGNQVNGYVVRLIKRVEGNLETPTIGANDF